MFKFATPDKSIFIRLVTSVDGVMEAEFDYKVQAALLALEAPSQNPSRNPG
jgi:hypothetical protein